MTISIPAYCPTCRSFFKSNAVGLGAGASVMMSNCITTCPRGHDAKFLDGAYSVKDNLLELASTSPETLKVIRALAEQALAGKMKREDAADRIIELAPSLAPILRDSRADLLPYLALLVYLVVELAKAAMPTSQPPTIINNWPTIKNEITVQQSESKEPYSAPTERIENKDHKHSKRKARRLRGKAKEEARRQRA